MFLSSQCSTTVVTKAVVCYPVSEIVEHKRSLAADRKEGFLSHCLNGPLPYVRCHITVDKNVLSVSLNKTFPPFSFHSKTSYVKENSE